MSRSALLPPRWKSELEAQVYAESDCKPVAGTLRIRGGRGESNAAYARRMRLARRRLLAEAHKLIGTGNAKAIADLIENQENW